MEDIHNRVLGYLLLDFLIMHSVLIKQGGILFSSSGRIFCDFLCSRSDIGPFLSRGRLSSSSYHRGNKGTGEMWKYLEP